MSSWIGVYGHDESELAWLRDNYSRADCRFKKIHPIFESEGEKYEHVILEIKSPGAHQLEQQYYWNIPCHWDSEAHFEQTKSDINAVLQELKGPKGLEVYLSPMVG